MIEMKTVKLHLGGCPRSIYTFCITRMIIQYLHVESIDQLPFFEPLEHCGKQLLI